MLDSITQYILHEITWQEIVAVVCAVVYIILAAKKSIWCWVFGNISCGFYIYLALEVFHLPLEAPLNAYYVFMGFYGWFTWQKDKKENDELIVIKKPWFWHFKWIGLGVFLTILLGFLITWMPELVRGAQMGYLDAFTTVFAFIATYLLANKVLENWWYWIAADAGAIILYGGNGYYFSALLFILYIIMSVNGLVQWKKNVS